VSGDIVVKQTFKIKPLHQIKIAYGIASLTITALQHDISVD